MSDKPATPLLDQVTRPADLKRLSDAELTQVARELRAETISAVSETGGHLGAGLGVVELTVALHAVFDTPRDKIIWDVSHQCYPHKILTERRDRIRSLRMKDGLSGFTKRGESPYDPFGAAHSSTSISAALGFAVGRDLGGVIPEGLGDAIAVIGDGAMSAGMAYEALNNAAKARNAPRICSRAWPSAGRCSRTSGFPTSGRSTGMTWISSCPSCVRCNNARQVRS